MKTLGSHDQKVLKILSCPNMRAYKQLKREQLARLYNDFETYTSGADMCPVNVTQVVGIRSVLQHLKKAHSVRQWGR